MDVGKVIIKLNGQSYSSTSRREQCPYDNKCKIVNCYLDSGVFWVQNTDGECMLFNEQIRELEEVI